MFTGRFITTGTYWVVCGGVGGIFLTTAPSLNAVTMGRFEGAARWCFFIQAKISDSVEN